MKKPIPFGKYLLLERINVGGMAEVFKAKAFGVEGFERLVAVKRILPSIAEDTEFITMFIDEAKIAVQLTHANVAQIFDLGKVGDSYFIAMEHVNGKDLRALFDRGRNRGEPIAVPMACYVIMKVCEGLDYAHNKKDPAGRDLHLVHRDVSPQNVLISYDGEVKIIDFGVAKAAGKAGKTQAGILKGKFGYMSPEQVRGLPLDRRSDVFAVGICLYELLTGERLFVGESDFSTLEKVRNVEIMPPSTYNRRIPEELEHIVLRALAKDADDRYQTAMDLHDDLQSFMYTSGNFFARKDLSVFQHQAFEEEIARETARDEEYRKMEVPDPRAFGGPGSERPPPQRGTRPPKRTMMGMGAPPPSGSPPRRSTPPPPPPPRTSRPPVLGVAATPPPPPRLTPPPRAASAGPALDMDWDEEELSTQIYDRPGTSRPPPGMEPAPMMQTRGTPVSPAFGSAPSAAYGAPSPFEAEVRQDPTEITGPPSESVAPQVSYVPAPAAPRAFKMPVLAALVVLGLCFLAALAFFAFGSEEPATIQLTTVPADVRVTFDGEQHTSARSPFVIAVADPDAMHYIEVTKDGFKTWMTDVDVRPGQSLSLGPVTLEPEAEEAAVEEPTVAATGFTLDSDPTGATVFVDDVALPGTTPVRVGDLVAGTHRIRVEKGTRYSKWQTQIEVVEGLVKELDPAVLDLTAAHVTFQSDPSGARVRLVRGTERRDVGTTPITANVELEGGPWTVEMSLSDHGSWSKALTLEPGQEEYVVEATLESERVASAEPSPARPVRRSTRRTPPARQEEPRRTPPPQQEVASRTQPVGTLRVNTRPWSEVFVDGRSVGTTPQMDISLSPGSHRVTLVNSEFNIRESVTVSIRSGQTTTKILTLTPGG